MSGFQLLMRFVAAVSFASPLAPSPAAAIISGFPAPAPGAGVRGVNVLWLTGGVVTPLLKLSVIAAWPDAKPSRMSASSSRVAAPSTKSVVERLKEYGLA